MIRGFLLLLTMLCAASVCAGVPFKGKAFDLSMDTPAHWVRISGSEVGENLRVRSLSAAICLGAMKTEIYDLKALMKGHKAAAQFS